MCTRPLKGVQDPATGKLNCSIPTPWSHDGYLEVPCGQCWECRLERSRQWAVRITHEAKLYERNSFITLTYDNEHLPPNRSLNRQHFQLFLKRLRNQLCDCPRDYSLSKRGRKVCFNPLHRVRYFHCGEYGDFNGRPHYHAVIFGHDFKGDSTHLQTTSHGDHLWTSNALSKAWPKGIHAVGNLTFESAAYVARYIMKKVTGDLAEDYYGGREPEYTTMSRRPGIGADWINKNLGDVYPSDEVIIRGKSCRPPKYYDQVLEQRDPELHERIKEQRIAAAKTHGEDQTYERLAVKETVIKARMREFQRDI